MISLHKILPIFIFPIMMFTIVICIGLIKNKKKIIYFAVGAMYILSTPIFSNNFFRHIEGYEYQNSLEKTENADAIVVLSGMVEVNELGNSTFIEWGDPDRFFGGIALLKANKAQKLVFTGGNMSMDKIQKKEGALLRDYSISFGIPAKKVTVTDFVQNTAQEAIAVRKILPSDKKIILVTSAYHMYRAKRLFEKQGFIVKPFKVDYKSKNTNIRTILDILPNAGSLELVEIGIREIIGRVFYLVTT